ncbi:MAG: hypothetical protein ACXADY_02845 [Candidatus Hodarchaeales archaeon]|jgi:hypothetical protein
MNNFEYWILNEEKNNGILDGRPTGDPIVCRYHYNEARFCYINRKLLATILTIAAAIEAFLANRIEFECFKKYIKEDELHFKLNLSSLNSIAKKEGKISKILYQKIDKFRYVRNAVIHPRDPSFLNLGFKYTSYTGEGISSRGGGFESPNGEPMLPLSLKEGAELGFRIYFHLRDELKIVE